MHIQDLILLVIGREHEKKLHGRATLQKKLYFLSALKKTDLGFGPHYYGPYSSSVAHNLDILVSCRFLREITESYSRDRSVLGEFRRHTYFWSDDSETVMNEIKQENGYTEWEEVLRMLNSHPLASDFNTLSIAAKTHYIANRQGKATAEHIRETAVGYDWDINEPQIQDVLSLLEALSLISVGETA